MKKMLDWLRFFPFASYNQFARPNIEEIQGPYFSKLRDNSWRFGDTSFHFRAPWANPILGFDGLGRSVKSMTPGRRNIFTGRWQRVYGSSGTSPRIKDQWWFYAKDWYFVGPWFTGEEGRLTATAVLIDTHQDDDLSVFHSKVFESTVCDLFDYAYGYRRSGQKPHYRAPLNWHLKALSTSIQAIVCDLHEIHNGGIDNPEVIRSVYFPVSAHQFVEISFSFIGLDIHDEVRAKPIFALCDSIIDSMRLEVGQSTQAEWDKVQETCPDMTLSDSMGEFKWPLFENEADNEPDEKDITPSGEPNRVTFKS
ncbi:MULTISPECIES: hypothetical protein [Thalassolituus]|uniref:hypothetical protein n=1 Tax=Thalassolituus TaxID=187492 RepID=UPI0026399399|nr:MULTISPECIES: hypothetical protein [Thalassolituus]|tara:strand:- start:981 stop:1907 length:927 start_codon:yes stop_codon:yes gene_type:complete